MQSSILPLDDIYSIAIRLLCIDYCVGFQVNDTLRDQKTNGGRIQINSTLC